MKRERKLAIMMGTDSALYFVFPIPRALLFIIDPYASTTAEKTSKIFYALFSATAIVEPILLLAFQETYRQEIKTLIQTTYLSSRNKLFSIHKSLSASVTNLI